MINLFANKKLAICAFLLCFLFLVHFQVKAATQDCTTALTDSFNTNFSQSAGVSPDTVTLNSSNAVLDVNNVTGSASVAINSVNSFTGDFDTQVNVQSLNLLHNRSQGTAEFGLIFASSSYGLHIGFHYDGTTYSLETNDTGSNSKTATVSSSSVILRIIKSGTTVYTYYSTGSTFILLGTYTSVPSTAVTLNMYSFSVNTFPGTSATFTNFKLGCVVTLPNTGILDDHAYLWLGLALLAVGGVVLSTKFYRPSISTK